MKLTNKQFERALRLLRVSLHLIIFKLNCFDYVKNIFYVSDRLLQEEKVAVTLPTPKN